MSKANRLSRLRKAAHEKRHDDGRVCEVEIHGEALTFRLTLGGEQACRLAGVDPVPALQRLLARQARLKSALVKVGIRSNGGFSILQDLMRRRRTTRKKAGGWIELIEGDEVRDKTQSEEVANAWLAEFTADDVPVEDWLKGLDATSALQEAMIETLQGDGGIHEDMLAVMLWGLQANDWEEPLTLEVLREILNDPADLEAAYAQARDVIEHHGRMYVVPGRKAPSGTKNGKEDTAEGN